MPPPNQALPRILRQGYISSVSLWCTLAGYFDASPFPIYPWHSLGQYWSIFILGLRRCVLLSANTRWLDASQIPTVLVAKTDPVVRPAFNEQAAPLPSPPTRAAVRSVLMTTAVVRAISSTGHPAPAAAMVGQVELSSAWGGMSGSMTRHLHHRCLRTAGVHFRRPNAAWPMEGGGKE